MYNFFIFWLAKYTYLYISAAITVVKYIASVIAILDPYDGEDENNYKPGKI